MSVSALDYKCYFCRGAPTAPQCACGWWVPNEVAAALDPQHETRLQERLVAELQLQPRAEPEWIAANADIDAKYKHTNNEIKRFRIMKSAEMGISAQAKKQRLIALWNKHMLLRGLLDVIRKKEYYHLPLPNPHAERVARLAQKCRAIAIVTDMQTVLAPTKHNYSRLYAVSNPTKIDIQEDVLSHNYANRMLENVSLLCARLVERLAVCADRTQTLKEFLDSFLIWMRKHHVYYYKNGYLKIISDGYYDTTYSKIIARYG